MLGNDQGRSDVETAPIQNDHASRRDQSQNITEVDHLAELLRSYGYEEWVIAGVRRWNRMRADGVKWPRRLPSLAQRQRDARPPWREVA
jgi:hypothetical protein